MIAPANTGRDKSNKTAVTSTDQGNSLIVSNTSPKVRVFFKVLIKFTAPSKEDTPAKCSEKIAKSTEAPECPKVDLRGGYTVHPVPAPLSANPLKRRRIRAGIKNQNLMLFIRGNAMSGDPIISGTSQFPNPPIKMGITIKKIMMKA